MLTKIVGMFIVSLLLVSCNGIEQGRMSQSTIVDQDPCDILGLIRQGSLDTTSTTFARFVYLACDYQEMSDELLSLFVPNSHLVGKGPSGRIAFCCNGAINVYIAGLKGDSLGYLLASFDNAGNLLDKIEIVKYAESDTVINIGMSQDTIVIESRLMKNSSREKPHEDNSYRLSEKMLLVDDSGKYYKVR